MRVVFMGTPDFAVPTLEALIRGGHQVLAVVTQPDKPKGRGKSVLMTPVKEKALEHGIPVYQPERIKKDEAFFHTLAEMAPDAIVVTAFGQILPERILNLPKYGCINVHASLLPKYRGSAPIQWAVINGDEETGITTMMMDVGLDTGDMLEKIVVKLDPKETGGSLFDRLSTAGGELILSTLKKAEEGCLVRMKQPEEGASYAGMLDKALGRIDWTKDAVSIERLIRGLNPWPSAYTTYEGKTLKLWAADVVPGGDAFTGGNASIGADAPTGAVPGQIVNVEKNSFCIQTGRGLLRVRELQLEGKKRMETGAFLRGYPVQEGAVLQ